MMGKTLRAAILIALCTAFGLAADVSGRWEGKVEWEKGEMQLAYTFKADGDKLSGKVETPDREFPITDGSVNGEELSFKVVDEDSGNQYLHHGKISGDTIQMTVEAPERTVEFTLKRAREQTSPM